MRRHHILSIILLAGVIYLLSLFNSFILNNTNSTVNASSNYSPPNTIADNCSVDVTSALNSWLATVPSNSTIAFPANSCYLINSTLTLQNTDNISILGNNTTLTQTTYPCGTNQVIPIFNIVGNINLKVDDLNINGPATCRGDTNEGDYGLMLRANDGAIFTDVTIKNVDGDGIALYPTSNTSGINTNIVFSGGALSNIGYHAVTPEGINGFQFSGNKVTDVANFMDLEVDYPCAPAQTDQCLNGNGQPIGAAQWNVSVNGNNFTNGLGGYWIESEQSACIPQHNIHIENNSFDATFPSAVILMGSRDTACLGADSGVVISGNISANPNSSPQGIYDIQDYEDVSITNNTVAGFDGLAGYFPNKLFDPAVGLCGVSGGVVSGNTFNNLNQPVITTGCWDWPGTPTSTDIVDCNNSYSLTKPILGVAADTKTDSVCTNPSSPTTNSAKGANNGSKNPPSRKGSSTKKTGSNGSPSAGSGSSGSSQTGTNSQTGSNATTTKSSTTTNNSNPSNTSESSTSGGLPITRSFIQETKYLASSPRGRMALRLFLILIATITSIIVLMSWKQRWHPFWAWDRLLHRKPKLSPANSSNNSTAFSTSVSPQSSDTSDHIKTG
ncbi:MAG TPA: hypothetical protein VMR18_02005 [Candidatus Saccharimonadales bacterium]|nr:hypothetical protein [Candidatus Saccharimonadales bacterium]